MSKNNNQIPQGNSSTVNRPPLISIPKNSDFLMFDPTVLSLPNPSPYSELKVSFHPKNRQEVCKVKSTVGSVKEPVESLDRYLQGKSLSKGQQLELERWFMSSQKQDFGYINLIQSSPLYQHMCISTSVEHIRHLKVSCRPNECHLNTLKVIEDSPNEYGLVQGFVYRIYNDGSHSVFTHSWNVDTKGNYYDFTPQTYPSGIVDEFYVGLQIPVERWFDLYNKVHESYLLPFITVSPKTIQQRDHNG
jgi:hypothetical protein